ncbi:MAG: hypothetical protein ACK4FK_14670 [Ferrovibrio sp.]|uniref:hypothetical protein n=1 Tax=Ferrovibrio sp. TaxID=1917215 RepID=UPI00391CC582
MKLRPAADLDASFEDAYRDGKIGLQFGTGVNPELAAKVPNPHLKRYIAEGLFSQCHRREYVNRRIDEFNSICQVLARSGHNPALLQKLLNCNKKRPSNLTLSPYCRQMRVGHDVRCMTSSFAHVSDEDIKFFTGIVAVLYGTPDEVEKQARAIMELTRRKLRNHHADRAKRWDWYREIVIHGYFEIELYRYRRSHKKAAEAGLDVETRQKMRKRRRKYKLLRKLGLDPKRDEDFYLLHWHALAYIPDLERYKKGLKKKGMFPHKHQIKFSPRHQDQERADRFRILAAYRVKAAPRSGRLFGKRRLPILPTEPLLNYVDLYGKLNYKMLSFNFGTAASLD